MQKKCLCSFSRSSKMQKKCLCSFNRRPKMQKNAFVHLVEDPKSKKTTFFIITNLPPQPFSSKYQMIFRCLKRFPANIKRYLSPARRTKAYPWGLGVPRSLRENSPCEKEILVLKKSSPYEEPFHFKRKFPLRKEKSPLKKSSPL